METILAIRMLRFASNFMSAFSPAAMIKSTSALRQHFETLHEIRMHPTKRIPGPIKA